MTLDSKRQYHNQRSENLILRHSVSIWYHLLSLFLDIHYWRHI